MENYEVSMFKSEIKRKRGGQPRNQNARKHGFYSNVLTPDDKLYLKEAVRVKGLDQEIDLLRAKLKAVVKLDSENVRLISQAADTLARLMRIRDRLTAGHDEQLQKAIENVYYNIALPAGAGEQFIREMEKGVEKSE
jgi:hypothetical protein